mmetsp:Transcript_8912/g.26392  ORF Transcript_8912/g.26392 Transcript_8912/m.26392 type:complete len:224 (-) Transcript_8912:1779-2450(-)
MQAAPGVQPEVPAGPVAQPPGDAGGSLRQRRRPWDDIARAARTPPRAGGRRRSGRGLGGRRLLQSRRRGTLGGPTTWRVRNCWQPRREARLSTSPPSRQGSPGLRHPGPADVPRRGAARAAQARGGYDSRRLEGGADRHSVDAEELPPPTPRAPADAASRAGAPRGRRRRLRLGAPRPRCLGADAPALSAPPRVCLRVSGRHLPGRKLRRRRIPRGVPLHCRP